MFRTPLIAAMTVALLGGTALAQPATQPPANLSDTARSAPDYDDRYDDGDRDYRPPVSERQANPRAQATADQQRDRDIFCRRDAAARTGYTTPREAARDEQARGSIGGTLGGAALGAIIGGATGGNAGTGAAIGAGAGLLAGTAIGADNARQAARDVHRRRARDQCRRSRMAGHSARRGGGDLGPLAARVEAGRISTCRPHPGIPGRDAGRHRPVPRLGGEDLSAAR